MTLEIVLNAPTYKMESQKIVNFLNTNSAENLPRFVTKK